jgi:hypothetical protein
MTASGVLRARASPAGLPSLAQTGDRIRSLGTPAGQAHGPSASFEVRR